jgi:hypothetical protein
LRRRSPLKLNAALLLNAGLLDGGHLAFHLRKLRSHLAIAVYNRELALTVPIIFLTIRSDTAPSHHPSIAAARTASA